MPSRRHIEKIRRSGAIYDFGHNAEHGYWITSNNLRHLENNNNLNYLSNMPLTYHFRPFPKPGEPHLELKPQQTEPASTSTYTQFSCQDTAHREKCRQREREDKPAPSRSSKTVLPSIKEEADPVPRPITPKAIRDQRRAARRISVSDAFNEAVGDDDYFTLYHPAAFARSPSTSSYRDRNRRRLGSATCSNSRKSSAEKALPPIPDLVAVDSQESLEEEEPDETRRDS